MRCIYVLAYIRIRAREDAIAMFFTLYVKIAPHDFDIKALFDTTFTFISYSS